MSLPTGTRLGPYEILAPIGAGGMGQVYKARDTRLDRLVAIKILSKVYADLRERFEREAKAIAALADPHICTLYDIGHQDGEDFLVMEYLEGRTLARRLSNGALPLDAALKFAIEIATALEKAHRAGIVHRDLKPGNVMLTKSGAKLLDFGLAKLWAQPAGDETVTMTEAALTEPGMIVGTLQYMAPEQLEGKHVDQRADLWALGCIVYEMIAGQGAFHGTTQATLIGAILHGTPVPLSTRQPLIPASLDRLVTRSLAKDPEERWQTATDLMAELSWIAADAAKEAPDAKPQSRRREMIAWASALVALILAFGMFIFGRSAKEEPLTRLDVVTPPSSDPFSFALSPDGRRLVFSAPSDGIARLWLRALDQTEAKPLAGTEGGASPFWSPDGRSIGFFADGRLKRLDLNAGASQILAIAPEGRGGTWTSDGAIIFTPTATSPLLRVPASGGAAVPITSLNPARESSHRWPQALPDGHLIFFVLSFANVQPSGIYLATLDGKSAKRLVTADSAAIYAPPGYLLTVEQGVLVARSLDLKRGIVGSPEPIAQPVATDYTIWRSAFSSSTTSVLAHRTNASAERQLVWVGRAGNRIGLVGGVDGNGQFQPAPSPDGRHIAVQRSSQGVPHTWIFDNGRDVPIRLREGVTPDARAVWTPDGKRIAFLTTIQGPQALVEKSLTGSARNERTLAEGGTGLTPLDYSEDGRYFLYSRSDEKTGWDIWALPLTGDGKPFPVLQTSSDEQLGQLSRDGKWIAYQSNESGRTEVYIRPFLREGATVSISTGGGIAPRWRRDGKELFYVAADGTIMSVALSTSADGQTIQAGAPSKLFRVPIVGGGSMLIGGNQQYAVAPDGQRFLINMTISEANAPITIVLNWMAALKR
ncbi:MAG TPA: protein kinase [Bryobacteraceae bacterium]|nr:protein kinase [Bryobacteraceae bacterium]